jgi:pimeloyl-ACP methyl ester carboxylesterase
MADVNNDFQKQRAVSKDGTETVTVNGVRLACEIHGTGEIPLVMVHGSWLSRRNWDRMVPHLPESLRVISYDRRGHGESERPSGQGSVREDVADLAGLIEHLELAPAWVAGQSFGGSITLRLAGERPDLLQGIIAYEPPLFALVADDPAAGPMLEGFAQTSAAIAERIASGDHAGAAEQFVEEGLREGLWAKFPPWFRQMMTEHAPTYLDEANDPDQLAFDLEWIRGFTRPALLTQGDQSPPVFPPVITRLAEALPSAEVQKFTGAGHPIMVEQPKDYAEAITAFINRHTT